MILKLDMAGATPIYQQIRNQIVFGVATGQLRVGEPLPTVRQLAADIGVNPMTVSKAYTLLKEEGVIVIDRRHGAQISPVCPREEPMDGEFDDRASLLISEARMKGASEETLKAHILRLIDDVYRRKEVSQ